MFRIIKSLLVIVAVGAVAAGATSAYFSSSVDISDNTFATGTLEIRVNGEAGEIDGFEYGPAAPGDMQTSDLYGIQNYGAPWFGGPSNLPANKLLLSVTDVNDDAVPSGPNDLWNAAWVKIEVGRMSGVMQYTVYEGPISTMGEVDLFGGHWSSLVPGSSQDMKATVWLPDTGGDQSSLMGQSMEWDFIVEGRTS
jgi:predicted ribosomally synthesized peptide with SipW-like signal peptide